ncbi:hypothetical protein AMECASPLE_004156 [Ameca splendens]|uniref:C1q domain-containing protein n=1 Tax=Ameca splendens TaxID=208324 RepID=A0ABV1A769_9TELE
MLERLEKSLNDALTEFTRSTKNQNAAIQSLRNDVVILQEHQNRVGGTLSDIEQRLDITEGKLIEKKAKLGTLEVKTEAAFNNTKMLLNSYKDQLSHLNSMAQDLEVHFEGRLNITKMELEEKLEVTEKNTEEMKTEASFNSTKTLLNLYKNQLSHLNSTTRELGVNFDSRLNVTKMDLEDQLQMIQLKSEDFLAELTRSTKNQKLNITSLRNEVDKLVKHQEIFGGNFSDIEKRLDATERQLMEEKDKLENLETKTEASFNSTKTLLETYKDELSHLNLTTLGLKVKYEDQWYATKTDIEIKLNMIQETTEELTRSTKNQKLNITSLRNEVDKLVKHQEIFGGNFSDIEKRLDATERQLMEEKDKLENLETKTEAAFNNTNILLSSYMKELSHLKSTDWDLEVKVEAWLNITKMDLEDKLEAIQKSNEVQKKIAFSATIIESSYSFTGPYSAGTSNTLKFDRVFTNIGNAYNKKTGIFTAPLNGVYQFSFMTFGYSSHTSGAILMKNGNYQVSTWEFTGPDTSDTTSNSVILEMNAGDSVNIILWQGGKIHTSVFSGFLIFPLV